MQEQYNLYSIVLDFILKVLILLVVSGMVIKYRKGLAEFTAKNASKFRAKLFGQEIEYISKNLKESQSQSVKSPEEEIKNKDILINKLQEELEFEKIYSIIFNSQLELLKILKQEPISISTYKETYFSDVRIKYRIFEDWSAEDFVKILLKNNLIQSEIQEYTITKKGIEFLVYIEENKYNDRLF